MREAETSALRAGDRVDEGAFAAIRRTCVLEHCKWDAHVCGAETLAPFPLLMRRSTWNELATLATALASETLAIEEELMNAPHLHRRLGMHRALQRALSIARTFCPSPSLARTMRFDFHLTTEGWRISEVNSDVPGGYAEGESFTELMAAHSPGSTVPGLPASSWASSVEQGIGEPSNVIALLSAPTYMEDLQVVSYLAKRLAQRGYRTQLIGPMQLRWEAGRAYAADSVEPLAAIVRFFQCEWLARLPDSVRWEPLFAGGATPVTNGIGAVMTESKRLPLVWPDLEAPTPAFARLLPETRDPRDAPWLTSDEWVLKPSFGNCGDDVIARPWVTRSTWARAALRVLAAPNAWVAQRRFDVPPIETPLGPMRACIGLFVIDGRVGGAYGRLQTGCVTNERSMDVAVLIDEEK